MATLTNLMTESQFLTGTTKTVTAIYDGITDSYKSQTGNHVVYLRAKISSTKTAGLMLRFWNSSQSFIGQSYNGLRVFNNETISTMYSLSGATYSDVSFQSIVSGESNTLTISNTVWIDLTASYGAGNEPTQAWCDEHIPYFTGTYELTPWRTVSATRVKVGSSWRNVSAMLVKTSEVPDIYQELTHITTDGNQYINTGVYVGSGYQIEMKFSFNEVPSTIYEYRQSLFGINGSHGESFFRVDSANNYSFWARSVGSSSYTDYTFSANTTYTVRANFLSNTAQLYINGTLIKTITPSASDSYLNLEIPLFCENSEGSRVFMLRGNFMQCKMWNTSGTLIRYYKPVRLKSTSEVGVYDVVTNTMGHNAGSGTFGAGTAINGSWHQCSLSKIKTY